MAASETAPHPAAAVLRFWFGGDPAHPLANAARWFERDDDFDATVRARFADLVEQAGAGALDAWRDKARPALALVILLDQFTRNLHRDSPRAFAYDDRALATCLNGLERGLHRELTPVQRWFFLMPLMHAEDLAVQERGLAEFRALAATPGVSEPLGEALHEMVGYAERHHAAIEKFGRFPHRNAVLGRTTTPEEAAWLDAHPTGF